jgi:hypothetical protein
MRMLTEFVMNLMTAWESTTRAASVTVQEKFMSVGVMTLQRVIVIVMEIN